MNNSLYSPDALANIALMYPGKKILYIEDALGIGIYSNFIEDNYNEYYHKLKIQSAYKKRVVIEVYKKLKERDALSQGLFILDLDYDKFLQEEIIEDKKVLYLSKYTLENHMINIKGMLKIISIRNSITVEAAEQLFNYNNWILEIEKDYKTLIPIFLTLRKKQINVKNVKAGATKYFDSKTCKLCENLLKNYMKEIKNEGFSEELPEYTYFKSKVDNDQRIDIAIPGKQLLSLAKIELNKILRTKINTEDDLKTILYHYLDDDFKAGIKKILEENFQII